MIPISMWTIRKTSTSATAILRPCVQAEGIAATIKHFACNNKEQNRRNCDSRVSARASVRNEGAVTGRETIQVYVSAPQGRLGKPARVLTAFAKTKPLAPGQEEGLTLSFAPYAFASFDDTGRVQKDAYVLEKGEYHFYVGTDVRQAALAEYTWILPENLVLCQLSPLAEPRHLKERLLADGTLEALPVTHPPFEADEALEDLPFDGQAPIECPFPIRYNSWKQPDVPTLRDVAAGKMTLEALMETLSLPEKMFLWY